MTELLPCPFCGFQPDINEPDCIYPACRPEYDADGKITFQLYNLVCYESAGGCSAHVLGYDRDECIRLWNTRTPAKVNHE